MITPEARTTLDKDVVLADCAGRWLDFYGQFTTLERQGSEWRGPCPNHNGNGPNFAVNAENGEWYCHTGCKEGGDALRFLERKDDLTFPEALQELAQFTGTTPTPAPRRNGHRNDPARRIVGTYNYTDEDGVLLFQAVRYEPKGFSQRAPTDTPGAWTYSLSGVRRVLYALPEVLDAVAAGRAVYLTEGEKDADALRALGLCATTSSMGAGKWEAAYTETLCGAGVVILPDNDAPGREHAQKVAAALHGRSKRVRVVELPNLPDKGDVSDWIAAGGTKEALLAIVKAAPDWNPENVMAPVVPAGAYVSEWSVPVPFTLSALPLFPTEALPEALAAYVSEVAATSQVPPDMPALLALAVVGAAGARRCRVQIGRTHSEPLNLFCAVVMEPGSRKSAVMDMTAPLRDYEAQLAQGAAPDIASAKARRAIEEKHLAHLQETAAKEKSSERREEMTRQAGETAGSMTEVPALPRLLADDVTPEKVAGLMAENAGALALLSAEGGIFGILAGRYSGKGDSNLDVFLKGHAGDEIRVDRQGRAPDYIRRPALTVGLLVQPDVIASLSDNPSFRGRGLLGRFLYALPPSLAGTRRYQDRGIDAEAERHYGRAIERILDLPDAGTEDDPTLRHDLLLTGEALTRWAEHADAVEARQAEGEDLCGIRDWASKLAGAVARIAGGFHLIENARGDWRQPLAPETVLAAWAVGEYLIPHALAAYGQMCADPGLVLARRILGWIERKKLTEFTLRECHQAHRSVSSPRDLEPALLVLCERGFLRLAETQPQEGGGRPKSPLYQVNPSTQKSQNTQN